MGEPHAEDGLLESPRDSPIRLLVVGAGAREGDLGGCQALGVEVEVTGDLRRAQPILAAGQHHAVLVDLDEGPAGLAALASVQAGAPDLPVLVRVAAEAEAAGLAAIRRGAQDYLVRGREEPASVVRALRAAIERQRWRGRRVRARARGHTLATPDALTGLPNRFEFHDVLVAALERAIRDQQPLALLSVGLDRFERVNGTLGRRAGDELLARVAERLARPIRRSDVVAHMASDEFMVMLPSVTRDHGPAKVAQTILASLEEPYRVAGRECWVTASIGIAVFPRDGKKPEALVRNAEAAMYSAKAAGANRHHYYAEYMNEVATERLDTEKRLRGAIRRDELLLHLQPQIDLAAGEICGAEALLRWCDPERGVVAPGEFIPIADDTGLIIPIGEWVLRAACQQAAGWSRPLTVAVNVSTRQLRRKGFADLVARVLEETRLAPPRLALEITESCALDSGGLTLATLRALRKQGVRISIDDFGTGYSSLAALKSLPVDGLKIDRSFVRNIPGDEGDATITRALITMARGMGRGLVAEGIETPEQMRFLFSHGCTRMQGYLFSKPLATDEFEACLAADPPPWDAPLDLIDG